LPESADQEGKSMDIDTLHHVSLVITDLGLAKAFYEDILGLPEIARPPFPFPGAWYQVGAGELHLIVGAAGASFRGAKAVNSRDGHLAIRVKSYRRAVEHLRGLGYRPDASDARWVTKENPAGTAGYPQLYILDPDYNVIEINAATLD
jgi:catechol 2,3-dioxygenase-like lactoylglutathione lyase family enzyme